jgi:hypothetical protein
MFTYRYLKSYDIPVQLADRCESAAQFVSLAVHLLTGWISRHPISWDGPSLDSQIKALLAEGVINILPLAIPSAMQVEVRDVDYDRNKAELKVITTISSLNMLNT